MMDSIHTADYVEALSWTDETLDAELFRELIFTIEATTKGREKD